MYQKKRNKEKTKKIIYIYIYILLGSNIYHWSKAIGNSVTTQPSQFDCDSVHLIFATRQLIPDATISPSTIVLLKIQFEL